MKKIKISTALIILFFVVAACFIIFNDQVTTISEPYWDYAGGYHYIAQDSSYNIPAVLLFVGVPTIVVAIIIAIYNKKCS